MNKLKLTVEILSDDIDGLADGLEDFAENIRAQHNVDFADGAYDYDGWSGDFTIARECDEGSEHKFERYGQATDGTNFYRCRICGVHADN